MCHPLERILLASQFFFFILDIRLKHISRVLVSIERTTPNPPNEICVVSRIYYHSFKVPKFYYKIATATKRPKNCNNYKKGVVRCVILKKLPLKSNALCLRDILLTASYRATTPAIVYNDLTKMDLGQNEISFVCDSFNYLISDRQPMSFLNRSSY